MSHCNNDKCLLVYEDRYIGSFNGSGKRFVCLNYVKINDIEGYEHIDEILSNLYEQDFWDHFNLDPKNFCGFGDTEEQALEDYKLKELQKTTGGGISE